MEKETDLGVGGFACLFHSYHWESPRRQEENHTRASFSFFHSLIKVENQEKSPQVLMELQKTLFSFVPDDM
jgi:hypothetical protein